MTYIGEMELKQRNNQGFVSPADLYVASNGIYYLNNSNNKNGKRIFDSVSNTVCNDCFSPSLAKNTDLRWSERLMGFYANHCFTKCL